MRNLYCDVTNTTVNSFTTVNVTDNHDAPISTATIETTSTGLTLGDSVEVDMGYSDDHEVIFTGYVKQIEEKFSPDHLYVITAYNNLVRAQDFFIASSTPESALSYQNIAAETLVYNLMVLAGLTSFTYDTTYFTFGINNAFEINLVSVIDYTRTIADLLTWSIWADSAGTVHFENRKPYVMLDQYPENAQPGWQEDVPTGFQLNTATNMIDFNLTVSERNLRNKVVVYGKDTIGATASASSPYLPVGFYKTAVLAFPQLVDDTELAQSIADYNLDLLNRITYNLSTVIVGDPSLRARTVISCNDSGYPDITGDWYVFSCDHTFSAQGYTTNIEGRRMTA